eukprot:4086302-Pyramimonas_sp.AAC.1
MHGERTSERWRGVLPVAMRRPQHKHGGPLCVSLSFCCSCSSSVSAFGFRLRRRHVLLERVV